MVIDEIDVGRVLTVDPGLFLRWTSFLALELCTISR